MRQWCVANRLFMAAALAVRFGGRARSLAEERRGYVAGDIKSGAGEEGATDDDDGKPKRHYAVQLALYTDILERLGYSAGRTPFVWDIHGESDSLRPDADERDAESSSALG